MPRGILNKVDILSRVLRLKQSLHDKTEYHNWNNQERNAADQMLNRVLDMLNEYSQ